MNPFLGIWHLFKFVCLLVLILFGLLCLRPMIKDTVTEKQIQERAFYADFCKTPSKVIRCKE